MKMSEVFGLPVAEGEFVNEECRRVYDKSGAFSVVNKIASPFVTHAINNHDNLVEALRALVDSAAMNEEQLNDLLMCSDYGESEALCKARQLLSNLE